MNLSIDFLKTYKTPSATFLQPRRLSPEYPLSTGTGTGQVGPKI